MMNWTQRALAALMVVASAGQVSANGLIYELKGGALYHDLPGFWSGFQAEKTSLDLNIEAQLSPAMNAFFGTIRPAIGASMSTAGQTSMAYVDARYTYDAPSGLFYAIGLGAAIHDGQLHLTDYSRKALGSRILFHIPLEFGYRFDAHNSVSAYFEHMSNAYTQRNNEGMDRLGVRYGYRF
jgi:lipid A 3-O-deacylase